MQVFPIRDQVVVVKEKDEEKRSAGGIIQVSLNNAKNVEGVVVAVGSGRVTMSGQIVPLEVQVGDRVQYNPSMVLTEVHDSNRVLLVLREDAVLCVFR